jgi:hypothetical protein
MTAGHGQFLSPRQKKAKPLKRRGTEEAEEQGAQAESGQRKSVHMGSIAA